MSKNLSAKYYQDKKEKAHERYQSLSEEEKSKSRITVASNKKSP